MTMDNTKDTSDIPPPYDTTTPVPPYDTTNKLSALEAQRRNKKPLPHWQDNFFLRTYRRRWITIELSGLLIILIITCAVMGSKGYFGRPQRNEAAAPYPSPVTSENPTITTTSTSRSNADCSNWGISVLPVSEWSTLSHYQTRSMVCIEWGGTPTPTLMQGTIPATTDAVSTATTGV